MIYQYAADSDHLIKEIKELYTSAFPANERRDFDAFTSLLANPDSRFSVICAIDDEEQPGRMLAFISFWDFEKITYLEHFAVIPQMRGRNIGRTMLRHFLDDIASRIILEVEPPTTDIARRRIRFYETIGLKLRDEIDYIQPPYSPDKESLEMKLMTHGEISVEELKEAASLIHLKVYGFVDR